MKKWKCPSCKQCKKTTTPAVLSPKPPVTLNEQPEDTYNHNHPSIVSIDTGTLLQNMNEQFQKLSHNITELRTSVNTRLDALSDSIEEWSKKYQDLENSVATVRTEVALVKEENQYLRNQINLLQKNWDDQKSRQCNLEIQNLPEKSSENLIHIALTLGKVLNVPVTTENIKTVHRVPHHGQTDRPKNIIVELCSRRLRDDVIAAARARRGVTAGQLMQASRGSGPSSQPDDHASAQPVFINEHLTLKNKILYSNTRKVAKDKQYKWTWIKNGAILVRKADNTKVKRIRCDADLDNL
ncbi:uncharacterized protein LOC133533188 [Cydia pomonella]|uniref:uncharacterized protein LOC133533188 n=1 Tax=Cydia pomonella TaxID=82600 RepID=UPI002ADD715A|nr:uncharacterized protein LOC133533188 [Cydia pomonella]